jgi:diguanylate cyclase (GGDEF)-like protein
VSRSKRYQFPTTVLLLDFDGLEAVNQKFGTYAGDRVLQESAGLLRECTRLYDLIARYGPDEFALVLPQTKADQAFRVAERLRRRFETHDFAAGDASPRLTVSIGLATYPADGEEVEDLLQAAETALLAAKQGRNRSCAFDTVKSDAAGA